jgi:polar amino acid transport system substrate-binding protein
VKPFKHLAILTLIAMLVALLSACAAPAASTAPAAPGAATTAPAAAQPASGKKFVFASDASFPPMESVDPSTKEISGFDMDLLAAIAKDQGFQYEVKNTAWDGIFAGLESGQYDAIISSVTVTDDRKKSYDFTDPYFDANQGIVVRPDATNIKTGDDLKGKTVGAQIGTTGAIAVKKLAGVTLKEYDTPDLAMQDLVNKNLDAVVVDYPVAANFALQSPQFKGKLQMAGQLVTNEKYGMVVRKGDPKQLLPLFNAGIKDAKANGTYNTIYSKWIGTPPSQ